MAGNQVSNRAYSNKISVLVVSLLVLVLLVAEDPKIRIFLTGLALFGF